MEGEDISAIIALLNPTNTIAINRCLAHNIGLVETVAYQALIRKYVYWSGRGLLDSDGSFYCTAEDMEESTTLSPKQQRRVLSELENKCLIKKYIAGMPAKRYIIINMDIDVIKKYLTAPSKFRQKGRTRSDLLAEQEVTFWQNKKCPKGRETLSYKSQDINHKGEQLPPQIVAVNEAIRMMEMEENGKE